MKGLRYEGVYLYHVASGEAGAHEWMREARGANHAVFSHVFYHTTVMDARGRCYAMDVPSHRTSIAKWRRGRDSMGAARCSFHEHVRRLDRRRHANFCRV